MGNYTAVTTRSAGQAVTSAEWNSQVGTNINLALMRPLAEVVLSGSAAQMDISSIPATFRHLHLAVYARGDNASTTVSLAMRINTDVTASYDSQLIAGSAAAASISESLASGPTNIAVIPAASAGANLFGAAFVDIPHYAQATNNKLWLAKWGYKIGTASGNLVAGTYATWWRNNSAISQLTLTVSAGNLVAGSCVTLYGLPL